MQLSIARSAISAIVIFVFAGFANRGRRFQSSLRRNRSDRALVGGFVAGQLRLQRWDAAAYLAGETFDPRRPARR